MTLATLLPEYVTILQTSAYMAGLFYATVTIARRPLTLEESILGRRGRIPSVHGPSDDEADEQVASEDDE